MKVGRLSFGSPPFLCVTWKIQLAAGSRYFLRSPEFPFADGRYCLRLFPFTGNVLPCVLIDLVNLTDAVPGRDVSYEVLLKSRSGEVSDVVDRFRTRSPPVFSLSYLQAQRCSCFPDGTVTLVCFVRLIEPSDAVIPESRAPETERAISRFRMCGELSFESPPFLYVTWKIPDFFSLASEYEYSLESPEFALADGRYCLRLFLSREFNQDFFGTRLLNLIDGDLGRGVSYQLGLKSRTGKETDLYFKKHVHGIYRSEVEEKRDSYVPDGTLTVFCFVVHPREPSSTRGPAETAEEEEKQQRVPELSQLIREPDFTQDYEGNILPDIKTLMKTLHSKVQQQFPGAAKSIVKFSHRLLNNLNYVRQALQEKHIKVLRIKQEFCTLGPVPNSVNKYLDELTQALKTTGDYALKLNNFIRDVQRKQQQQASNNAYYPRWRPPNVQQPHVFPRMANMGTTFPPTIVYRGKRFTFTVRPPPNMNRAPNVAQRFPKPPTSQEEPIITYADDNVPSPEVTINPNPKQSTVIIEDIS